LEHTWECPLPDLGHMEKLMRFVFFLFHYRDCLSQI
jgi:hypothetical protein